MISGKKDSASESRPRGARRASRSRRRRRRAIIRVSKKTMADTSIRCERCGERFSLVE